MTEKYTKKIEKLQANDALKAHLDALGRLVESYSKDFGAHLRVQLVMPENYNKLVPGKPVLAGSVLKIDNRTYRVSLMLERMS